MKKRQLEEEMCGNFKCFRMDDKTLLLFRNVSSVPDKITDNKNLIYKRSVEFEKTVTGPFYAFRQTR